MRYTQSASGLNASTHELDLSFLHSFRSGWMVDIGVSILKALFLLLCLFF